MKLAKNQGDANAFSLIARGVEVTGDILFQDRLHVEGVVTGKVVSEGGTLVIEESGRVEAQVAVAALVIRGMLTGNATAKSRIEVHKTSRVRGDLKTPVLLMEEGAILNGNVGMSPASANRGAEANQSTDGEDKIKVKGA